MVDGLQKGTGIKAGLIYVVISYGIRMMHRQENSVIFACGIHEKSLIHYGIYILLTIEAHSLG